MKNKKFKVTGYFTTHISKYISAKSESEAMRKARDSAVKNMKLKSKDFDKQNCAVWEV